MMRSTAEAHGQDTIVQKNDTLYKWKRDPLIAEAMVDERVAIPNLIDTGKVLTFTAQEAQKWGYCDGIAENPESLGVEAEGDYTVKFTFKTEKDPDSVLNAFLSSCMYCRSIFLIRAITHPSTVLLSGRLRSAVGLLNT